MINKVSLTSSSNSQNIFSVIQNRGIYNPQELSIISNNLNKFNINNETYYFNRRIKSRFFNVEKTEESTENNFKSFSTNSDSHSNKSESEIKKYSKEKNNDVMDNKKKMKKKIKNSKKGNKYYKRLRERDGDWTCYYCKNLNFTFRNECNRCHITKEISDKGHEQYFQDVLIQINANEEKRLK